MDFDLGFDRAGLECLWQVEKNPYAIRVLDRHWPTVPKFTDVCTVGAELPKVDVIAGGFPCTDISLSGKGAGLDGKQSGLWREFRRIISLLRPRFVVVENVRALVRRGLSRILLDFAQMRYDAQWQIISAADVGAPHIRERLFLVAYPCEPSPRNIFGSTGGQRRESPRTLKSASLRQDDRATMSKGFGASGYFSDPESGGRETDRLPIGEGQAFPVAGNDGFGESNGLADPRREHGESGDVSRSEREKTAFGQSQTKEPERCGGSGGAGIIPDPDGIGQPQPQGNKPPSGGRIGDGSLIDFIRTRSAPFFQAPTFPRLGGSVDGFPDWLWRHTGASFDFRTVGESIDTLRANFSKELRELIFTLSCRCKRTPLAEFLIQLGTLPKNEWVPLLNIAIKETSGNPIQTDSPNDFYDTFDGGVPRVGKFKNRSKRLEGLGNAVVPFIAEWIGLRLLEQDNE